jgi:hypothetical protein
MENFWSLLERAIKGTYGIETSENFLSKSWRLHQCQPESKIGTYPHRKEADRRLPNQVPQDGKGAVPFIDESGLIPTPHEVEQRQISEQARREQGYKDLLLGTSRKQANANVAIARLTGALVIVTIVGGCVSYLQFMAAKKSADAAQDAVNVARDTLTASSDSFSKTLTEMQRQVDAVTASATASQRIAETEKLAITHAQRAFITFGQSPTVNTVPTDNSQTQASVHQFRVTLENTGMTPARDAHHYFNYRFQADPLPIDFNFSDNEGGGITPFVIGPRQLLTGGELDIRPEILLGVKNHQAHLFFWGWVTYWDVFPNTTQHVTMFCSELTDVYGDPLKTTPFPVGFSICIHHNCTDQDCDSEPGNPLQK